MVAWAVVLAAVALAYTPQHIAAAKAGFAQLSDISAEFNALKTLLGDSDAPAAKDDAAEDSAPAAEGDVAEDSPPKMKQLPPGWGYSDVVKKCGTGEHADESLDPIADCIKLVPVMLNAILDEIHQMEAGFQAADPPPLLPTEDAEGKQPSSLLESDAAATVPSGAAQLSTVAGVDAEIAELDREEEGYNEEYAQEVKHDDPIESDLREVETQEDGVEREMKQEEDDDARRLAISARKAKDEARRQAEPFKANLTDAEMAAEVHRRKVEDDKFEDEEKEEEEEENARMNTPSPAEFKEQELAARIVVDDEEMDGVTPLEEQLEAAGLVHTTAAPVHGDAQSDTWKAELDQGESDLKVATDLTKRLKVPPQEKDDDEINEDQDRMRAVQDEEAGEEDENTSSTPKPQITTVVQNETEYMGDVRVRQARKAAKLAAAKEAAETAAETEAAKIQGFYVPATAAPAAPLAATAAAPAEPLAASPAAPTAPLAAPAAPPAAPTAPPAASAAPLAAPAAPLAAGHFVSPTPEATPADAGAPQTIKTEVGPAGKISVEATNPALRTQQ